MGEKDWKKNCKKLAEPKKYVVFDASDRDAAESKVLGKYSNVTQLDGLRIPEKAQKVVKKLLKSVELDSDPILDDGETSAEYLLLESDKIDKKFIKGWEKNIHAMDAIHVILKAQLEGGRNSQIFVVFRQKDYKIFSMFIKRSFERVLGYDPDGDKESNIVFGFDQWKHDKKYFEEPMKDNQMARIDKTITKMEDQFCNFDAEQYAEKVRKAQKSKN